MAIDYGSRLVRRKQGSRKNHGHYAAQDLQVESLYHRKYFRLFGITLSEGSETSDGTRLTIMQKEATPIPRPVNNQVNSVKASYPPKFLAVNGFCACKSS
jgi:hypothetical protein